MARVNEEDFEYQLDTVAILEDGDRYEACQYTSFVLLSEEHLTALKEGKVLYWSDGESSTVVRYGTKDRI